MSNEENFKAAPVAVTAKNEWMRFYGGRFLLAVAAGALVLGVFVIRLVLQSNFHVVSMGKVYRSGQMDVSDLRDLVRERGIKTIVNLRGPAEGTKGLWYNAETNLSQELGVKHFDFSLLAGHELKNQEMEQIMETLSRAPKPILIHCKSGSDRTGLVGALYLYSLEGKSAQAAAGELSVFCGHVPYLFWRDTIAMDHSFWRFVGTHAPGSESGMMKPNVSVAAGPPGQD